MKKSSTNQPQSSADVDPSSPEVQSIIEAIHEVFERRKEDGTPHYSDEDIHKVMPLLLLIAAEDGVEHLPELEQTALAGFLHTIGVREETTKAETARLIAKYVNESKMNEELLLDIGRAMGIEENALLEGVTSDMLLSNVKDRAQQRHAVGAEAKTTQARVGDKRPEGTVSPEALALKFGHKIKF